MSRVVTSRTGSTVADEVVEQLASNNASTKSLSWALACLASLTFLCLGGELKEKIISTASALSVHLDGQNLPAMMKHNLFLRND